LHGAAFCLPFIASSFSDVNGWRYAITIASVLAILYGVFYYFNVSNTPKGSTYFKPKKSGAMEVSSYSDYTIYSIVDEIIAILAGDNFHVSNDKAKYRGIFITI
jgi:NNP family nitrate/nitrite transporter-like MFS transporter